MGRAKLQNRNVNGPPYGPACATSIDISTE